MKITLGLLGEWMSDLIEDNPDSGSMDHSQKTCYLGQLFPEEKLTET